MVGEKIFFHTAVKGKTVMNLPSQDFRGKQNIKFLFGYSDNHWV